MVKVRNAHFQSETTSVISFVLKDSALAPLEWAKQAALPYLMPFFFDLNQGFTYNNQALNHQTISTDLFNHIENHTFDTESLQL